MTATSPLSPSAIELLRGPPGGLTRAHEGLAAFWRAAEEEPPLVGAGETIAALDAWLDDRATSRALVLVPGAPALLARWAVEVVGRGRAQVAFVPIGRAYGTTLEREALPLLFGLLDDPDDSAARPCSARGLRRAIRDLIRSDREPEAPLRLIVFAGLDELSGWSVGGEQPLVRDVGARTKVVVSAAAPRGDGADPWLEQLGWRPDEVTWVALAAPDQRAEEQVRAIASELGHGGAEAGFALRSLCLLAGALGPVDAGDLEAILELPAGAAREALAAAWPCVGGLLNRDTEATGYRFHDEGSRRTWESIVTLSLLDVDAAVVEAGQTWLTRAEKGAILPHTIPRYLVSYHGAHLRRVRAGLAPRLALVTPAWLAAWTGREDLLFGFLEDVASARAGAESALRESAADLTGDPVPGITGVVRCALVSASLLSLEALSRPGAITGLPFRAPVVDFRRVIGAGGARAQALLALAGEVSPPRREALLAWAREAIARDPTPSGEALLDVARVTADARRSAMARRAADAFRRSDDERHDGQALLGLLRVSPFLDGEERRALVHEAVRRTEELDRVMAAPWELGRAAPELPPPLVWELYRAARAMSAPNRALLRAWIAPHLLAERRDEAIAEASALLDTCIPRKGVPHDEEFHGHYDADGAMAAVISCMPEPTVREVLTRALGVERLDSTLVTSLAVRLAALGHGREALELVRRLPVDPSEAVELSLRLATHLPEAERSVLGPTIEAFLRTQDDDRRGRSMVDHPEALVRVLGPRAALALTSDMDAYFGVVTKAALAPYLPTIELRAEATAAAVEAYRKGHDGDTLHALVRCSAWMSPCDAVGLLCVELDDGSAERDLPSLLLGWCSVRFFAPLIARIGGDAALIAAAGEIVDVAAWLP